MPDAAGSLVRQSEVISALSRAVDLTEGQPMGHAARSCMIGMRLAADAGLDAAHRSALFYALLLKDVGCSSTAARVSQLLGGDDLEFKAGLKRIDWNRPSQAVRHIAGSTAGSPVARVRRMAAVARDGARLGDELVGLRCDRGARILQLLDFPDATVVAMASADEHWDGHGKPAGLRGEEISLLGRIVALAQTAEVFFAMGGPRAAADVARRRNGTWFDPALVAAFERIAADAAFWRLVAAPDVTTHVAAFEPAERVVHADDDRLDLIAEAFARVVDAKSPFTSRHSERVAETAVGIASVLGLGPGERRDLRRAGLLHDLGKLGVPNSVLDKPGRLTPAEWELMRRHPAHTAEVLAHVECLRPIAGTAASHHERLDGSGYHRGLEAARCRFRPASWRWPTSTTPSPTIGHTTPPCRSSACSRSWTPMRGRGSTGGASRRFANSSSRAPSSRRSSPIPGRRDLPSRPTTGAPAHYPRWPGFCSHPLSRTPLRPTTRPSVAWCARCFAHP